MDKVKEGGNGREWKRWEELNSIPNLALFFDDLEKNWKEADFN